MYDMYDNWAVMACAKLWADLIIIFHIRATCFFKIWIMSSENVCEMCICSLVQSIFIWIKNIVSVPKKYIRSTCLENLSHRSLFWTYNKCSIHHYVTVELYVWVSEWVSEWVNECVSEEVCDWMCEWMCGCGEWVWWVSECVWQSVLVSVWVSEWVSEWVSSINWLHQSTILQVLIF